MNKHNMVPLVTAALCFLLVGSTVLARLTNVPITTWNYAALGLGTSFNGGGR